MSNSTHEAGWRSIPEGLWHDVRLALVSMRAAPVLTAVVVATLGLGIGVNTAIFGVVNSLLLRPLPVAEPERLASISFDSALRRGVTAAAVWKLAMWERLQPHLSQFDGGVAWLATRFDLSRGGEMQGAEGMFASGDYFRTLGVPVVLGRTFTAADDVPGGGPEGPVAVISYDLWQRRFGGATSVIGSKLFVDNTPVSIVGVTPPAFGGVEVGRAYEVALPLNLEPLIRSGPRSALRGYSLAVLLRLKPGQSIEAGTATLRAIQPQILGVDRAGMARVRPTFLRDPFTLVSAANGTSGANANTPGLRQRYSEPLLTLLAVVGLVLLIACVNIANLLIARAAARRHELSVRLALGATRLRLVRQLLVESLVLSALGAFVGLLFATWGGRALIAELSAPASRITLDLAPDWRLLIFTAGIAIVTTVLFGTLPALRATKVAPVQALKSQGRMVSDGGSRRSGTLAHGLVVAQIALSLALVIAAGLFVRTFQQLAKVPLGFDRDRVLVVNVDTRRALQPPPDRMAFTQRLVDATAAVPGVAAAGASMWTPIDGGMRLLYPELNLVVNFVTTGWFETYGMSVRLGRDFTAQDTAPSTPVAIVNNAYVRKFLEGRSPIGDTTRYPLPPDGTELPRTIVGLVDDAVFGTAREGVTPMVYIPLAQSAGLEPPNKTEIGLSVRAAAGSPALLARGVGAALTAVDPGLAFSYTPLVEQVNTSVAQERLLAMLSAIFGGLALLIAALGIYGVTSYTVTRRQPEFGIRLALGAQPSTMVGLAVGRSLVFTTLGICAGIGAAVGVTRYISGMLFGVTPLDIPTFIIVTVLFAAVGAIAALIPARRASRVDPLIALRGE